MDDLKMKIICMENDTKDKGKRLDYSMKNMFHVGQKINGKNIQRALTN